MQVLWQNTGLNICICVEGGFWSHVTSNIMHYPILWVDRKRFVWLLCFCASRSSQQGTEKTSKASVRPCGALDILCHEYSSIVSQLQWGPRLYCYVSSPTTLQFCRCIACLHCPCCIFRTYLFFLDKNLIGNFIAGSAFFLVLRMLAR